MKWPWYDAEGNPITLAQADELLRSPAARRVAYDDYGAVRSLDSSHSH